MYGPADSLVKAEVFNWIVPPHSIQELQMSTPHFLCNILKPVCLAIINTCQAVAMIIQLLLLMHQAIFTYAAIIKIPILSSWPIHCIWLVVPRKICSWQNIVRRQLAVYLKKH